MVNRFIMELIVIKTTALADRCYYSCVPGAHRLEWNVDILCALAPLVGQVGGLGEHDLIEPDNLLLLFDGTLQFCPHDLFLGCIPSIFGFLRHLGCSNDLSLDEVGFVDGTQSPWLDEFVRVGAMEEDAALLDTLGDPSFQRLL